jgi:hypothetical protein
LEGRRTLQQAHRDAFGELPDAFGRVPGAFDGSPDAFVGARDREDDAQDSADLDGWIVTVARTFATIREIG